MKYIVYIEETLVKAVEVEAEDSDAALDKITNMYDTQKIVLDSSDYCGVDFFVEEA